MVKNILVKQLILSMHKLIRTEIIFWDNASTDQTSEIAQSYDNKLRYFRSQETTILGTVR